MKILKNKKSTVVIFLVILIAMVLVFLDNKKINQQDYSKELWNRMAQGDTSSSSCKKAIEQYSQENPLNGTNSFESFYSYSKKRCLGLGTLNFNAEDGKYAGHTDKIFDLITGDTIVSCIVDYSNKPNLGVSCRDTKNNWEANNNDKILPPPYPIYLNTWLGLMKLGKE